MDEIPPNQKEKKKKAKRRGPPKLTPRQVIQDLASKNVDNEVTHFMGKLPFLAKPVQSGRLKFHAEIDGFNSNRNYFGFTYKF